MATPTWPATLRPSHVEWRLVSNTGKFVSPFTGSVESQERQGARWLVTLSYDQWRRHEIAEYEAFIVALRGCAGRFYLWHHARENPRGLVGGAPLVMGADQTGDSLITDGWTPSLNGVLLPGDHIGVAGELKMVVEQADSDALGQSTLRIEPPIRTIPSDNTALILTQATGLFMLVDDEQAGFSHDGPLTGFTIQVMEDF
ncbi:MAG: hypothetical protein JMN25_15805 [gamma proteobacterium endosymbiont of Lamellibrachia anaximandri]|nr:hypothetical protein [gamma proteobacterium endosymbiont of Lamellibrachia anaximandri]